MGPTLTDLQSEVIRVADSYVGKIRETAKNDHPKIREWWPVCRVKSPVPWCAIAVCGVVHEAGEGIGVVPELVPSASVHALLRLNKDRAISPADALKLLTAGIPCVVLHDAGGGLGHCGIGFGYDPKTQVVKSYDANTNAAGSREGDSYLVKSRPISYWDLGAFEVA